MSTKKDPTTREEFDALTVHELEKLATKRGLTVIRTDGESGEPLKSDYIAALAGANDTLGAPPRERIPAGSYTDAQGHAVNEDGARIDRSGNVIEE